jgi:DNA-directed RNA polymerase subunit RPC12/RpoP
VREPATYVCRRCGEAFELDLHRKPEQIHGCEAASQ